MLLGERPMSDFGSRFALGRASYELHHDELEAFRNRINSSSSSLCALAQPALPALPNHNRAATEYATWKSTHPSVLDHFDEFASTLRGKRLAVFLDYDGTLTPIVKNPDAAFMSDQMRAAVRAAACLFPTSIISGRGREKVQSFVQLKELFYAGSHGMDIVGPKGVLTTNNFEGGERDSPSSSPVRSSCHASTQRQSSPFALSPSAQSEYPPPSISNTASQSALTPHTANPHAMVRTTASPNATPDHSVPPTSPLQSAILLKAAGQGAQHAQQAQQAEEQLAFQPAAKYAPIMDAVHEALSQRVKSIPGATVEHNKFCVSVHFRNCAPESYDAVVAAVKDTLQEHSNLKASRGRKVLEIQPQVDWGKGRALAHMLVALGLDDAEDVIPIYLGDDRTDEDAFKVLKERSAGLGILISSKAKPTDAKFTLKDPSEVMAFLTRLVQWGSTQDNAWHAKQSCTGWALKASGPSTSNTDAAAPSHTAADSIVDEVSTSYNDIPTNRTHSSQHNQQQHSDNGAAAHSMHMTDAAAGTSGSLQSQTGSHNSVLGMHQPAFSTTSPFAEPSTSEARTSTSHASVPHATGSGSSRAAQTPSGVSDGTPLGYADFRREATGSADVHDARRASLDHYLSPEDSSSRAWQPEPDLASSRQQGFPGDSSKGGAHQQLSDKNGERLTALLLDKLHGHAAQSVDHEDVGSPPAVTSNDSGSMAGYRSPFESLASYGVPEDAESIHAEHGSAASLRVMPSVE